MKRQLIKIGLAILGLVVPIVLILLGIILVPFVAIYAAVQAYQLK